MFVMQGIFKYWSVLFLSVEKQSQNHTYFLNRFRTSLLIKDDSFVMFGDKIHDVTKWTRNVTSLSLYLFFLKRCITLNFSLKIQFAHAIIAVSWTISQKKAFVPDAAPLEYLPEYSDTYGGHRRNHCLSCSFQMFLEF